MVALIVVFPVSLILGALGGLASLVGRPFNPTKLNRWLTILQVGIVPIMLLVGLILGVMAGGSSRHFRTVHGISGLILVLCSFTSSAISFVRRRQPPARASTFKIPPAHSKLLFADRLLTALTLVLVLVAWMTGLDDLRNISLCIVDVVSMVLIAAAVTVINWFWEAAIVAIALEWWLSSRGTAGTGQGRASKKGGEKKGGEHLKPLMAESGYKSQLSPGLQPRVPVSPYRPPSSSYYPPSSPYQQPASPYQPESSPYQQDALPSHPPPAPYHPNQI